MPLLNSSLINCPSRNQAGVCATSEIRQNIKFAAFLCVFWTKIKIDPECWCKLLSFKQFRKKIDPNDNLT